MQRCSKQKLAFNLLFSSGLMSSVAHAQAGEVKVEEEDKEHEASMDFAVNTLSAKAFR